jgi:hypothetical protein
MQEHPIQILEVRADERDGSVAIIAAVTADASRAISVVIAEQLARHRHHLAESVEDVLLLREQQSLLEQFAPLATAHAVMRFTDSELRACLVDLTAYAQRVDGEHFQPVELRERLEVITQITAVLWDASAAAATVSAQPLTPAAP